MLDQVLDAFNVIPDHDLSIMKEKQTLFDITTNILNSINSVLDKVNPDIVLVHGDTSTTFVTALACFYKQIPVGHVEAGLRTYNIMSPYPEEFNRQAVGIIARYNFSPTELSKQNLIKEGVRPKNIFTVGNTVIDALITTEHMSTKVEIPASPFILMTVHRREHSDSSIRSIFESVARLCENFKSLSVIYPVHKSPHISRMAHEILSNVSGVTLTEPLCVSDFHALLRRCHFILTDSGGIQEEATYLGKPTLIVRENTERLEALSDGPLKLIGTDSDRIYKECHRLLTDETYYRSLSIPSYIYGKGDSADKIIGILRTL